MKDKKAFGSFIKEKRIEKNFSQKDLADLLFVTEGAVSKWERGVSFPDITLISDICRILEVTEHELIESSNDFEYRKIKKDAYVFNRMKKTTFWTINICYILALLTCFIVNLAVNHTLSWFFIVLSSIICAYTFLPTVLYFVKKYKTIIFAGSTFLSLFLLFLTCSIYTTNYWFLIPTISLLLLYFIIFYPILFFKQKKYLEKDKYDKLSKYFLLTYTIGIFVLILLLLLVIYCYSKFNIILGIIILGGIIMVPLIFGIINLFNKNLNKICLLSLASIIVVVLLVSIVRILYLKGTEILSTYNINVEYNEIIIDSEVYDINIHLSNENKIIYKSNKKIYFDIEVVDEKLKLKQIDERKFYDKFFDFNKLYVDIYLTKDTIKLLEIENNTGDVWCEKGFVFENVLINNSTGDIKLESNIQNDLEVTCSTGDIKLKNINILGNTILKTNTGDIYFHNVNCGSLEVKVKTGDTHLVDTIVKNDFTLNGRTGNVILESFDASNINIKVTTGNIQGTLLSSKFFIAKSDTGPVIVPETREGGECRLITDTGKIIISYIS